MLRTYDELLRYSTFEERYNYLKLDGKIGESTFGYDRYINQKFYSSSEWRRIRDIVIIRDKGCDLGLDGYDIFGNVYVHHMNPITVDDIINRPDYCLNPLFLISTSYGTHQAITYGDVELLRIEPIVRRPNDTIPWRT